jgi:LuxR family transcriptional regulator
MELMMERWKELQLIQLANTTQMESAYRVALSFAKNIGYKFCAFSTNCLPGGEDSHPVQFNNYPKNWNIEYEKNKLDLIDPVIAHCNQSVLPILWSKELFNETPWLWDALEQQGLRHGWSQAIHDEESGLCSILSLARSHCPVSSWELYENLGFSVFIGNHLHKLMVQTLPKAAKKPSTAHLTPREVDVLKLAADGKTAYESARILNLSARTINFHVQEAIRKLGVNNKISAVIVAVKAGYLTSDAMR